MEILHFEDLRDTSVVWLRTQLLPRTSFGDIIKYIAVLIIYAYQNIR